MRYLNHRSFALLLLLWGMARGSFGLLGSEPADAVTPTPQTVTNVLLQSLSNLPPGSDFKSSSNFIRSVPARLAVPTNAIPATNAPAGTAHATNAAAATDHPASPLPKVAAKKPLVSPEEALRMLLEGNQRYLSRTATHPRQTARRRVEVAAGQHPVAAILGCADSRLSPEIIFDQGIGDLFVVRVAGNVLDNHVIGSLEYAVEHLQVPLIMVLGHERCGAVMAAAAGGHAPGCIQSLVEAIQPAVAAAQDAPGDKIENIIRINVERIARQLSGQEPILTEFKHLGYLKIVGARYDLDTGKVDLYPLP